MWEWEQSSKHSKNNRNGCATVSKTQCGKAGTPRYLCADNLESEILEEKHYTPLYVSMYNTEFCQPEVTLTTQV